jgi:hypothetical protein
MWNNIIKRFREVKYGDIDLFPRIKFYSAGHVASLEAGTHNLASCGIHADWDTKHHFGSGDLDFVFAFLIMITFDTYLTSLFHILHVFILENQ